MEDKTKTNPVTVDINFVRDIEKSLVDLNDGLPKLPQNIINFLVTIAPWFTLIGGILGSIGILFAITGSVASRSGPIMNFTREANIDPGFGILSILGLIIAAVMVVIDFMAFLPLRSNKKKGWDFMFYNQLLTLVANLLSWSNLGTLLIGTLIFGSLGFYILFQVRPNYKY